MLGPLVANLARPTVLYFQELAGQVASLGYSVWNGLKG